jgi:hypothetical protein
MQAILIVIEQNLVPVILAAIPGLLVAGWAWWKARAALSAAVWDDASVKWVEEVAKAIVEKSAPPPPPVA